MMRKSGEILTQHKEVKRSVPVHMYVAGVIKKKKKILTF
jgi:hypothetical protein